ncbi:MAG: ABC transporter ATP-binding protein [Candidatus Saccharimonas sp.]
MDSNIAVSVKNVSKEFRLPYDSQNSLKGRVINFKKRGFKIQKALKDISFEVKEGEFLGIVGRNGSGKSTLLKLIAGIYSPTRGTIKVQGRLTPFIELGVGFSPELSGRDNVYLNGALLGFSRSAMDAMYEEIVAFAELEEFMDQKLKNYSSGMQVRLAFSIAIKVSTDVLVLDEVLAVGDAAFQQKCFDYFMNLKKQKKTVILVTHDMGAVRQYCDRAIMVENGVIAEQGSPERVALAYQQLFIKEIETQHAKDNVDGERWGTGEIRVLETKTIVKKDFVTIDTKYQANVAVENPVFGLSIYSPADIGLIDANTFQVEKRTGKIAKGQKVDLTWEIPNIFVKGRYRVSVGCASTSFHKIYDQVADAGSFRIPYDTPTGAILYPPIQLSHFALEKTK